MIQKHFFTKTRRKELARCPPPGKRVSVPEDFMKQRMISVLIACMMTGGLFGCDAASTQNAGSAKPPQQTASTQQMDLTESGQNAPQQDTLSLAGTNAQGQAPALAEVAVMTDADATKALGGVSQKDIRTLWGEPNMSWDTEKAQSDEEYNTYDEWSYTTPDLEQSTAVRVYYDWDNNYQTIKEAEISKNSIFTPENSGKFQLTEDTVNGLTDDTLMKYLTPLTRRTIIGLLGSPWGHAADDPHTEIWECFGNSVEERYKVSITFDAALGTVPQSCHITPPSETVEYVAY